MRARRYRAVRDLALAVGLACVLVLTTMGWLGRQPFSAQAWSAPGGDGGQAQAVVASRGAVGPAWTSTEPVTIEIGPPAEPFVWPIPQYGVTVTFPAGSFSFTATFAFTPEPSSALPAPALAIPYFFELRGNYVVGDRRPVSLNYSRAVTVEMRYDQAAVQPVLEGTIRAYYRPLDGPSTWVPLEERSGSCSVDPVANLVRLATKSLGHFGLGGYRSRALLPAVFRLAN